MPWFALIGRDRPNGLEHRKNNRPAHLEHMARLDAAGRIRYGRAPAEPGASGSMEELWFNMGPVWLPRTSDGCGRASRRRVL